ncbi:helix-turn-helix transcriptional regulator [Dyella ginsengisoli]|uniref:Helix-turn-helix transcriptional regulator n=1 Tax=Dyella ginsengisoli TaxID=363848 RepID=A0ABW8JZM3_9GAMM
MRSVRPLSIFPQGHFLGRTETRWSAGGFALARMVPTVPEHEVHEHTHAEAHFVVLLRGEYLSSAEGAPALAREPLVVYNPPGTLHRDRFRGDSAGGEFMTVTLGMDTLRDYAQAVALPDRPRAFAAHEGLAWRRLAGLATTKSDSEGLLTESLCAELLDAASEPLRDRREHLPPWLWRVRECLHDDCGSELSLGELAAVAGVHAVHLTRSFRRHFGCTPGDYLRRCRLAKAAALLTTSREALVDVAARCGYFDQAHFARSFQAAFGRTPRAYRHAVADA